MFKTFIYHKISRDRFEVSPDSTADLANDFKLIGWTNESDLNNVFQMFNTIDVPFWEHPDVTLNDGLEGARSLSVGDVIQTKEGDLFEVQPMGFKKVQWVSNS